MVQWWWIPLSWIILVGGATTILACIALVVSARTTLRQRRERNQIKGLTVVQGQDPGTYHD